MSGSPSRPGPSDDGANQVWGLISTLVAGPAVWGAVGFGVDRLADTAVFTPVGVVVGFLTSFYIVYAKATHTAPDPAAERRTGSTTSTTGSTSSTSTAPGSPADRKSPQHGRSEVPTRDAARPDPGDVR